ncbi:hypothetical protein V4U86_25370 [Mycobacterium sp. AMU20-3851]|uniref:hypothetical protein n=1 Tax=Mycobacterium sp. AMU20-3851 TaxID=3122055 RepID=UPI003754B9AC
MGRPLLAAASVAMLAAGLITAPPAPAAFEYQPLWPFASQDEADRWAREDGESWHADAGTTALRFTREYLRFGEITRVTDTQTQGAQAWIGVGYSLGEDEPSTVATIHLVRFGDGRAAPWEVVGTRDEVLTLGTPSYGAAVGPSFDAGGTISGVDESLRLQVRQSFQDGEVGGYCCLPAGGQDTPWSAEVTVDGAEPGVATLVVSTGGHVAEVERFAVTGLRFGG